MEHQICEKLNSSINCQDLMWSAGYQPAKETERDAWYRYKNERTASLKIDKTKNRWYNFATGTGGKPIDLAMHVWECDLSEAIVKLKALNHGTIRTEAQTQLQVRPRKLESETEKILIKPLANPALISYLDERGISFSTAKASLQEIYIKKEGRNTQFFVGLKNDAGGYNMRNKMFKRVHGHNAISTIEGNGEKQVIFFEGFMDFLSYREMNPNHKKTAIVLNSTANVDSGIKRIESLQPKSVELFLDNDASGRQATDKIKSRFPFAVDRAGEYQAHKDLNDFLVALKKNKRQNSNSIKL